MLPKNVGKTMETMKKKSRLTLEGIYEAEQEKSMAICPVCLGNGFVSVGGMFSEKYKCDYKNCKANKKNK